MWMEALYHVPLSFWAVGGLLGGKEGCFSLFLGVEGGVVCCLLSV